MNNIVLPKEFDGYMGSRKKPEDFDAFWKLRRAEADTITPEFEISDCTIHDRSTCIFRELRFTGINGERIFCKYLRPNTEKEVPLVLAFHGYEGSGRSYLEQSSFVALGYALIVPDCPGQGGFSEDRGSYPGPTVAGHVTAGIDGNPQDTYYVKWYQNIRILTRIAGELKGIDRDNIVVVGGSQGAAQAIAAAALSPEIVKRAAVLYPFLADFDYIYETDSDSVAYKDIRYYATWFDPMDNRGRDWLAKMAYYDTKNMATLVNCPVLMGISLADTVCPPKSQAAVYNNLSCQKELHLYPGMGHEEIQEFDDLMIGFLGDYSGALYEELKINVGNDFVNCRIIRPGSKAKSPVCFYFHDCIRGIRGWHWLNRFAALGYAVVCMDNGLQPKENYWEYSAVELTELYRKSRKFADNILSMEWAGDSIALVGDGLGASLAVAAGAWIEEKTGKNVKTAVYNPVMADISYVTETEGVSNKGISMDLDTCGFAKKLQGTVLLGTGMKDREVYVKSQIKLAGIFEKNTGSFLHQRYVRCGHDRNNFFENELINWI